MFPIKLSAQLEKGQGETLDVNHVKVKVAI